MSEGTRRRITAAEQRRLERRVEESERLSVRVLGEIRARTGLTTSGLITLGLAVLCWLVGYVVGGRPVYLLSYACLGALGLAVASSSRPFHMEGTRSSTRPRVLQGETVDVTVQLSGTRRFSSFVLEEEVPPTLGDNPTIAVSSFSPGQEVDHAYTLTLWRRGRYELGPLTVRWGDPFGLTERRRVLVEPFEVLVHPDVEMVQDRPLTRMWEDPPIRPPVSKPWPTGMEFYGMRTYARGDDPRQIVWRAFARTGQLLIRESEQGITDRLTLILDTNRRSHTKGAHSDSFEAGVKVAASAAHRHLSQGYTVTVESNERRLSGPSRGAHAYLPMLDALARVERARATLADALVRQMMTGDRDSQLIVVTPLLDFESAGRLRVLAERGNAVLVAALMWSEEALDTLASAAALGAQVVEIGPKTSITDVFARSVVGAGVLK